MKCIVIYFSQTGNTEKIARAIQAGVKRAAGHCEIVKIKEANPRRLYEYDLIGLGTMVMEAEPGNVTAFINDMRFAGGKHIFAFATHGTTPEQLFPSMVPKLKRRGLVVIGTRDWYGNCCIPFQSEPYATAGHPDEVDLKEAEEFGKEMVERSRKIAAGETGLIPPVPKAPTELKYGGEDTSLANKFHSMAKFNIEKCIYPECRLCMDNCPMDGIDLSVKPPVFAKPCINCVFCEQICPTGAIDAEAWYEAIIPIWNSIFDKYVLSPLVKAEAEGRFRRLVPVEKIGRDNPIYMARRKHPRWIIGKGMQ
jgi:flavodoxin/NAD-dependent dihydropyrimidine dehydrogenase PreA subunit